MSLQSMLLNAALECLCFPALHEQVLNVYSLLTTLSLSINLVITIVLSSLQKL